MTTANELQEQGLKHYQQKDFEEAARAFQKAHDLYLEAGDHAKAAEMNANIGLTHRSLGEYQQALDVMMVALRAFQEQRDPVRAAQVLGNMGGVYVELGDKEQAYACYKQAADVFSEQGEKKLYADTMSAIGALQIRDRKLGEGATNYELGAMMNDNPNALQRFVRSVARLRNRLLNPDFGD